MISQKRVRDPVKHLRWNFLQNIYLLKNINYFRKKLHTRCLTRFQIRHWMSLVIGKEGHLTLWVFLGLPKDGTEQKASSPA